MPSKRSEDKFCRKSCFIYISSCFLTFARCFCYNHHPFYTLSSTQTCKLLVLCSQEFFCCTTQSICFFAEFDPKTPMEVSPLAACVVLLYFSLCVLYFFLLCLIISLQEIKYPYLHPHLTHILNLAAICNSIPKNQFDVCGRSFLQTKKEGIQCYNLRIKYLICN